MFIDGFWWLALTIGVAGIVRGFTGFGTALIFVPVAGRFLPAADVIFLIALTGLASSAALFPRAWRTGDRGEVGLLLAAAVPAVPLGLWAMSWLPDQTVRWAVAAIAGVTLLSIITGLRYDRRLPPLGLLCVGGLAGAVGGMTGLTGPVILMAYLASRMGAEAVRSNTILFLLGMDILIFASLLFSGTANPAMLLVALGLSVPYVSMTLIGQRLFDPGRERLYRLAAYIVIAGAVLTGLPLWDG